MWGCGSGSVGNGRLINSTPSLVDVAKSSGRLVVRTARHKLTHSKQWCFVSSAFSLGSRIASPLVSHADRCASTSDALSPTRLGVWTLLFRVRFHHKNRGGPHKRRLCGSEIHCNRWRCLPRRIYWNGRRGTVGIGGAPSGRPPPNQWRVELGAFERHVVLVHCSTQLIHLFIKLQDLNVHLLDELNDRLQRHLRARRVTQFGERRQRGQTRCNGTCAVNVHAKAWWDARDGRDGRRLMCSDMSGRRTPPMWSMPLIQHAYLWLPLFEQTVNHLAPLLLLLLRFVVRLRCAPGCCGRRRRAGQQPLLLVLLKLPP